MKKYARPHSPHSLQFTLVHYNDVIMDVMASQTTSLTIVYSIVYSGTDQRKHQISAPLAFVRGIHRGRWIPRTKGQLHGKCFHLMTSSCQYGIRTASAKHCSDVRSDLKRLNGTVLANNKKNDIIAPHSSPFLTVIHRCPVTNAENVSLTWRNKTIGGKEIRTHTRLERWIFVPIIIMNIWLLVSPGHH